MITIKELPVQEMRDFMQVYEQHAAEVPFMIDGTEIPVELDIDAYQAMEDSGYLTCVVAEDEGKIAGYLVVIAYQPTHHKGKLLGITDAFYVLPEYRNAGVFKQLVEYADNRCKQAGILTLLLGVNQSFPDAGVVASKMGYNQFETYYIKG